jgi:hypothetical protein
LLPNELTLFNNRGYPHINIKTYELGWFLRIDDYNAMLPGVNSVAKGTTDVSKSSIKKDILGISDTDVTSSLQKGLGNALNDGVNGVTQKLPFNMS